MSTLRTLGLVALVPARPRRRRMLRRQRPARQPAAAAHADGRAADGTVRGCLRARRPSPAEGGGFTGTVQAEDRPDGQRGDHRRRRRDRGDEASRARRPPWAAWSPRRTWSPASTRRASRTPTSTMVISVPSDKLDSTLEQLKSLGTITSRVISSDDVTTQVADVASRVKALEGSIARLNELSKKAGTISQLTELESRAHQPHRGARLPGRPAEVAGRTRGAVADHHHPADHAAGRRRARDPRLPRAAWSPAGTPWSPAAGSCSPSSGPLLPVPRRWSRWSASPCWSGGVADAASRSPSTGRRPRRPPRRRPRSDVTRRGDRRAGTRFPRISPAGGSRRYWLRGRKAGSD